jgi:hypothetical protein
MAVKFQPPCKIVLATGLSLAMAFILSCSVASTTAALGVSTGSTSGGGKKETIVYNNQPSQQQPIVIYQQVPAAVQTPANQQNAKNSSIRNFAVKSYDKIAKDSQKGGGEHLNSLILLMESEGVPKDESASLIKRALRKSNGNAEIFGDEIENSL